MSKSEKFSTRSLQFRRLNRKDDGSDTPSSGHHRSMDADSAAAAAPETSGLKMTAAASPPQGQSSAPSPPPGADEDDDDDLLATHGNLEASAPIVLDTPLLSSSKNRNKNKNASSTKNAWKVKYQDFLPPKHNFTSSSSNNPSSDGFQKLVDKANDWLKKNGDLQVKTCETVTWMSHNAKTLGDGEQMVLSKRIAENGFTFCLRGLRLWLVPRVVNKPQTICYCDFVPNNESETIQSLVSSANAKIEQNHLKGQILTVETVEVPIVNGDIGSGVTVWRESGDHDSPYAFVLRVFYNKEVNGRLYGAERIVIGLQDMIPLPTDDTYEGFEDLMERTNSWLKDKRDLYVINLQSVMVQKTDGPHSETGSACYYSQPGVNRPLPVDFFRILRIAFLKPVGDLLVDLPVIFPLTFETFTPELIKSKELGISHKERLEKMKETFAKVIAFLQNSGAEVLGAETVANPMQIFPQANVHILPPSDEIRFLLTIRLYLTGKGNRIADGSARAIRRASVSSGGNKAASAAAAAAAAASGADESDHPGPIFLRHVVNRRFKYRWLVLAITAITCMTTIVIVSVIYSNL